MPKKKKNKQTKKKGGRSPRSAAEDFATPASPNAGKTKYITCDGKQFSVKWLDDQTEIIGEKGRPATPYKFERYSSKKVYLCKARQVFGDCTCDRFMPAFGNRKFRIESLGVEGEDGKARIEEVWLCANCQQHFDLLRNDERRRLVPQSHNYVGVLLPTGENETVAFLCKGSCMDFAKQLSANGHIIIRVEDPPTPREMEDLERAKILFGVRRDGNRRGSKHLTCARGTFEAVYKTLRECPNVEKVWKKTEDADGSTFYFVISVLYEKGNGNEHISFVPHVDITYLGKPEDRSNWTIYMYELEDGAIGKVMRFQDRQTGWWFDIHCTHGTIVQQSKYASGIHTKDENGVLMRSPISHAVFNANNTCTLTWDHGRKCDGINRPFTTEEIAAAYQIDDDAKDDEELSDDDNEDKKPAAK